MKVFAFAANSTAPSSIFFLWDLFHDLTDPLTWHISLSSPLLFKSSLRVNSSKLQHYFSLLIHLHTSDIPTLDWFSLYFAKQSCDCLSKTKLKHKVLHVPFKSLLNVDFYHAAYKSCWPVWTSKQTNKNLLFYSVFKLSASRLFYFCA